MSQIFTTVQNIIMEKKLVLFSLKMLTPMSEFWSLYEICEGEKNLLDQMTPRYFIMNKNHKRKTHRNIHTYTHPDQETNVSIHIPIPIPFYS